MASFLNKYYSQRIATLTILAATCACYTAAADFGREIVPHNGIGQQIAWAKPLDGGPLRILFIAPYFSLGDVAELASRLDMQYETAPLWTASSVGYDPASLTYLPEGGAGDLVLSRLQDQLRKRWDVIVLANLNTEILPEEVLSLILAKVAGGTGLVTAHLHDTLHSPFSAVLNALEPDTPALPLWAGIAECALPGGSMEHVARILHHEGGRIVILEYPGDPPRNHCLIQTPLDIGDLNSAYENNAYALAIRALCLAARRDNKVRISDVRDLAPTGPDDLEIPPDLYPEFIQAMRDSMAQQPSRPFELVLNAPADQRYTVHIQLRKIESDTQVLYRDTSPMARGALSHRFEIPIGPGEYMIDIWLHTRKGVADWFTSEIEIPGWPEFQNLALEKTWLLPTDSLDISLDVRPVAGHDRKGVIYARARDGFNRVVAETSQDISAEGGTVVLRLHFSELLSALATIEVYALGGTSRIFSEWELHCAYRELRSLPVRGKPDPVTLDLVAIVPPPREYAELYYLKRLSEFGVSTIHTAGKEGIASAVARSGLRMLPELIQVRTEQARNGIYREPCLNDPLYRERLGIQLQEDALYHWAGGHTRYSLGGKNYICATEENVCQCRHCLALFQKSLQEEYKSLQDLNAAWQSDFGDWDFIDLPANIGPGQDGPLAPWLDFRVFMDRQFAEFHQWGRNQVLHSDTLAQTGAGFGHDETIYRGYNWPLLFRALDFAVVEYSPQRVQEILSYSPPGSWSGVSLPDSKFIENTQALSWLPWHLALQQLPGLWLETLWGTSEQAAPGAWLLPDGSASSAFEALTKSVREVQDSVGPLLYASTRPAAKIAIYDSHASFYFSMVNKEYPLTTHASKRAAASLLRLSGHDFRFIDKSFLPALTPETCAAVILPLCSALDAEEQHLLANYVSQGGALISDTLPGTHDTHGQSYPEYPLALLFGVTSGNASKVIQSAVVALESSGNSPRDAGWAWVDAGTNLTEGLPLAHAGETPAWIINRYGNGHTLLLNHPFRPVTQANGRWLAPAEWDAIMTFLADLPNMAGAIKTSQEVFLGQIEQFTYDTARVYAVLSDTDAPRQDIRLPLGANDIVYNALTGERIRRPHRHRFRMAAGAIEVVTCLPHAVKELRVETPVVAYTGQQLEARIMALPEKGKSDTHLFIVDLIPWNKPPLPWYRRILKAPSGFTELRLPLAKNEMLGRYTLRARDALTGMETTAPVTISSPAQ